MIRQDHPSPSACEMAGSHRAGTLAGNEIMTPGLAAAGNGGSAATGRSVPSKESMLRVSIA